jgi:hypothetical protein
MTAVIDITFHGSAFPTTYIGDGTLIGNPLNSANGVSGYFTGAAAAVSIPLGFQPCEVQVVDETNVIVWKWFRGLAATHTLKQIAGSSGADVITSTVDTGSAIVVVTDNSGNSTVTLSATLAASSANLIYKITG